MVVTPFHQFLCLSTVDMAGPMGGTACEVADCLGRDGAMRNYVVQLAVPNCRTTVHDGLDDLPFLLSNPHSMISSFVGCGWLNIDSIQSILKLQSFQFAGTFPELKENLGISSMKLTNHDCRSSCLILPMGPIVSSKL
jgi:hypothetical protein